MNIADLVEKYKANPDWEQIAYYIYKDEGALTMLSKVAQSVCEDKIRDVQIIVNSAVEEWATAQAKAQVS